MNAFLSKSLDEHFHGKKFNPSVFLLKLSVSIEIMKFRSGEKRIEFISNIFILNSKSVSQLGRKYRFENAIIFLLRERFSKINTDIPASPAAIKTTPAKSYA